MLKIFGHIILSLLLLIPTTGVVVSEHYCQEDLVSVSVFAEADSCCDMENCCHNETKVFQLKTDFSLPFVSNIPPLTELHIWGHNLFTVEIFNFFGSEIIAIEIIEPPPPRPIHRVLSLSQAFLL